MSTGDHVVLCRFGELWLKGKNRGMFERTLMRNARVALAGLDPEVEIVREHGIVIVRPTRRAAEVARRLREVFGFSSISLARACASSPAAIAQLGAEVFREAFEAFPPDRVVTFRIKTQRADKKFPLTSPQIDVLVAEAIARDIVPRLRVDLGHAELVLGIHVREEGSYVYVGRDGGAGGLPTGSVGRAVTLLSGGIDSPVAAWMTMKRGCEVVLVSFHSYPWVGQGFERKVERLAQVLARYQARTRLVFLPLAEIQQVVKDQTPPAYRTVLYRRMMQRLASRVAREEHALALVTGESLGQVASQTLENLACIEEASELPVLRPLIGFDKPETIALAQRIGTFSISIENEPDCCTVFQPPRPILRGRIEDCLRAERGLPLEDLLERALTGRRVVDLQP